MSASQRPPRRRKSSLADEHPAWPSGAGTDTQTPDAPEPSSPEPSSPETAEPSTADRGRAATRARARDRRDIAEARARAQARDAAWSWARAQERLNYRSNTWAEQMTQARQAGTDPAVLQEYVREAIEQSGTDTEHVPRGVRHAARLDAPDQSS